MTHTEIGLFTTDNRNLYLFAEKFTNEHTKKIQLEKFRCLNEVSFSTKWGRDDTAYFYTDDTTVYADFGDPYSLAPIIGAKPKTFEIIPELGYEFSQSGNTFFYRHSKIAFDPRNAVTYRDIHYSQDSLYTRVDTNVYFNYSEKMPKVDTATFTVLSSNVAKDKNHVYFRTKIINEADAPTFVILSECLQAQYYVNWEVCFYAKDKTYAYWVNTTSQHIKIIKTKSLDSFTFFVDEKRDNYGFAKDLEYEYNAGKRKKLERG
ncbi:MAG: hypothetical protein RLZZ70_495 [Candidatus Parcubacteria bacterium]|jgi:hypothetical protein